MKNIAFFLTPKQDVACLYDDFTLRQSLEKLRRCGYTAIPVITRDNQYVGTVSEGDFLWYLVADGKLRKSSMAQLEEAHLRDVIRQDYNPPVTINTDVDMLLQRAMQQNFIPVVDDLGSFIGIVTRKDIIKYFAEEKTENE